MDFLLIALLTLLNGVFAMSELALASSRKARLTAMAQGGDKGAQAALDLLVKEVAREMTVKSGQKCTAIRRVFVPEALYDTAQYADIPLIPGIATASELMRGLERGWRRFKFFPAESSGGVAALKGFAGPFAQARFCPTGGIDLAKAPAYLALPNVACVGGSWMLPADALKAKDWQRIGDLAREAAALGH